MGIAYEARGTIRDHVVCCVMHQLPGQDHGGLIKIVVCLNKTKPTEFVTAIAGMWYLLQLL